jgi:ABC-type polysaccharide/polyol phosphate transport system ATPase subunit
MKLIEAKDLTFEYRVIRTTSTSFKEVVRDVMRGSVKISPIRALNRISFSLDSGEILGIVGGNGAGKSTLLKILAGVLPPLTGSIKVTGNVAPMIALGAGFHPEMTGNENTIFYSALVGRDLKTVKSQLTEIGEWAGTLDHMDYPMRSFSSGMIARLAFSAATHERADILLIDEVLSVGDAKFRNATRQRIASQVKQGSSVVLVSHEEKTIREMCDKVIWLERGNIRMIGKTDEVMNAYKQDEAN